MSEMSEMPTTPAGEYRVRRDSWLVAVTIAAMITMMAAVVAAELAFRASNDAQRASETRVAAASATIAPTGTIQHVDVELGEFYIRPATISVPAGTPLLFHVTNKGTVPHNFTVAAKATPDLAPGASADLAVDARPAVPGRLLLYPQAPPSRHASADPGHRRRHLPPRRGD